MKQSLGVAVEVGLTVALLSLSISSLLSLRRTRAGLANWRAQLVASEDYRPSPTPLFPTLGGVTADGLGAAMLSKPPKTYYFVAFVIHAASLASDAALWTEVTRLLAKKPGLRLVGYCDGSACNAGFAVAALKLPFPVIGYPEYRTARVLLHADADRRALVLDGNLAALGSVAWTGASPPAEVAAAVARLL